MSNKVGILLMASVVWCGCQTSGFPLIDQARAETAKSIPVEKFVKQIFTERAPLEQAREYGSSDVSILGKMLFEDYPTNNSLNQGSQLYWSNIVVTLGVIGDLNAWSIIKAFLERRDEKQGLTMSEFNARISAIMGLGYLVNRNENQDVLKYLSERCHTEPDSWPDEWVETINTLDLQSFGRGQGEQARLINELKQEVRRAAILGAGFSGKSKVDKELVILQSKSKSYPQLATLIAEARKTLSRIHSEGLDCYYAEANPKCQTYLQQKNSEMLQ